MKVVKDLVPDMSHFLCTIRIYRTLAQTDSPTLQTLERLQSIKDREKA